MTRLLSWPSIRKEMLQVVNAYRITRVKSAPPSRDVNPRMDEATTDEALHDAMSSGRLSDVSDIATGYVTLQKMKSAASMFTSAISPSVIVLAKSPPNPSARSV